MEQSSHKLKIYKKWHASSWESESPDVKAIVETAYLKALAGDQGEDDVNEAMAGVSNSETQAIFFFFGSMSPTGRLLYSGAR